MNRVIKIFIVHIILLNILDAGIGSAAYQKLGMDARGIAMGRAVIANSFDASAVFWNPANLIRLDHFPGNATDMMVSHMSNTEYDIQYITAAIAKRWSRFGIGIGLMSYGVDEIECYDEQMNYQGDFTDLERSIFGSMAFHIPYVMNVGFTAQYLTQGFSGVHESQYQALGLKSGITAPLVFYPQIIFSLAYNNRSFDLGTAIDSEYDKMRSTAAIGIGWYSREFERSYISRWLLTTELEQETQFPLKVKLGAEVYIIQISGFDLMLRVGLDDLDIETRSRDFDGTDIGLDEFWRLNLKRTFGFGINMPKVRFWESNYRVRIDYAFVDEAYRSMHFFTIGFSVD